MSSLAIQADLIVATLDLKLVRLLRDAIRTADIAGGKIGSTGDTFVSQANEPRGHLQPDPVIEPRRVVHPTPRYEPRKVYRTGPTIESRLNCAGTLPPICADPGATKPCDPSEGLVLAPPWRMPVWKMPIVPPVQVKVQVHRVDVHDKGSLIDLFL